MLALLLLRMFVAPGCKKVPNVSIEKQWDAMGSGMAMATGSCIPLLPWPARKHTATSFLRNCIPVCCSAVVPQKTEEVPPVSEKQVKLYENSAKWDFAATCCHIDWGK